MPILAISEPKYWVKADKTLDFVPLLSTLTNITELITKIFCQKYLAAECSCKNRLAMHINNKSFVRCFLGLIPVLGNIAIIIYTLTRKLSPLEILKKNAKAGNSEAMTGLASEFAKLKMYDKALKYYKKASDAQHLPAVLKMAEMYETGCFFDQKIPVQQANAIALYQKLDTNEFAQYRLGCIFFTSNNFYEATLRFKSCIEKGLYDPLQFLFNQYANAAQSFTTLSNIRQMIIKIIKECSPWIIEKFIDRINIAVNNLDDDLCKDSIISSLSQFYADLYSLKKASAPAEELDSTLKKCLEFTFQASIRGDIAALKRLISFSQNKISMAQDYILKINTANASDLVYKLKNVKSLDDFAIVETLYHLGNEESIAIIKELSAKGLVCADFWCAQWKYFGMHGMEMLKQEAVDNFAYIASSAHYFPAFEFLVDECLSCDNERIKTYIFDQINLFYPSSINLYHSALNKNKYISESSIVMISKLLQLGFAHAGKELLLLYNLCVPLAVQICKDAPHLVDQYFSFHYKKDPSAHKKNVPIDSFIEHINRNEISLNSVGKSYENLILILKENGRQLKYFSVQELEPDQLMELLCLCPNIRHFHAQDCKLNDRMIQSIAETHPKIRHLHLENNNIGREGLASLAKNLSQLQTLNLTGNEIDNESVKIIGRLKKLECLYLSNNHIGFEGAQSIANNLKYLQLLNLSDNQICDEGVRVLARKLKLLQTLSLCNNQITDKGAREIAHHLRHLENLNLSENPIGDAGVIAIAENLTNLQALSLNTALITYVAAVAISRNLKQLQILNLDNNKIGEVGAIAIGYYLTELRILELADNEIGNTGAIALSGLKNLKELYVSSNNIRFEGARAIANKLDLAILDVSNNPVGNSGASIIAFNQKKLNSLNLQKTNIDDKAIEVIAKSLKSLNFLNVSENKITDAGVSCITHHLFMLKELDISHTKVTFEKISCLESRLTGYLHIIWNS